jgi:precorrin-3B C17-methyltransferase
MEQKKGHLYVVGIGPGHEAHLTPAALKAISQADFIVGYGTYIKLVKHLIEGKEIMKTGMTEVRFWHEGRFTGFQRVKSADLPIVQF